MVGQQGLGKFMQMEQVFIGSAAPRIAFLTGSYCITKARQLTARCRHALTSLCKLSSHTSSMQCRHNNAAVELQLLHDRPSCLCCCNSMAENHLICGLQFSLASHLTSLSMVVTHTHSVIFTPAFIMHVSQRLCSYDASTWVCAMKP